jgi:hypothetical protein
MTDTHEGRERIHREPGCTCRPSIIIGGGHYITCPRAADLNGLQRYSDGDFSIYIDPADTSGVYLVEYPGQSESDGIVHRLELCPPPEMNFWAAE